MPQFELDEGAVAQAEELLRTTGDRVNDEAQRASDDITSLSGAGWLGAANAAAANKQTGEFQPAVSKLHGEIHRLSEMLGLGRVQTVAQDQDSESAFHAITPGDGNNFGRL